MLASDLHQPQPVRWWGTGCLWALTWGLFACDVGDGGGTAYNVESGTAGGIEEGTDAATPKDCETCVCEYRGCEYNHDCEGPTGTTCQEGVCIARDGSTQRNKFQTDCENWLKAPAQASCDHRKAQSVGLELDRRECKLMRVQQEGHSSKALCEATIDRAFATCMSGCATEFCNAGCQTFKDQESAQEYFVECLAQAWAAGDDDLTLTITGNQALASDTCTTFMKLSCESGLASPPQYDPCSEGANCYEVNETALCTNQDGDVVEQRCCLDSGIPAWAFHDECPLPECYRFEQGSGICDNRTAQPRCIDDGHPQDLVCCQTSGVRLAGDEQGRWFRECYEAPLCNFGSECSPGTAPAECTDRLPPHDVVTQYCCDDHDGMGAHLSDQPCPETDAGEGGGASCESDIKPGSCDATLIECLQSGFPPDSNCWTVYDQYMACPVGNERFLELCGAGTGPLIITPAE